MQNLAKSDDSCVLCRETIDLNNATQVAHVLAQPIQAATLEHLVISHHIVHLLKRLIMHD